MSRDSKIVSDLPVEFKAAKKRRNEDNIFSLFSYDVSSSDNSNSSTLSLKNIQVWVNIF